jgi:hypothetical protein
MKIKKPNFLKITNTLFPETEKKELFASIKEEPDFHFSSNFKLNYPLVQNSQNIEKE